MESVGGPDAKKARWSPTSLNGTPGALSANSSGGTTAASSANVSTRDAFANYGYGPQASINQPAFQPSSSPAFTPTQLYSTPSLSINTGVGMNGQVQMSPHPMTTAGFAQQQQHQQHQQQQGMQGQMGQFGYGMLGMGLPSGMLGGFGYASPSGTFGQVRACFVRVEHSCSVGFVRVVVCPRGVSYGYIGLCAANSASFPECEYSANAWGILACCPLCCSFGCTECPDRTHRVRGQSTCHSVCRRTIESCPFRTTRVYPRSPREVMCIFVFP